VKIFLSQGLATKPLIMAKSLWEEASDGVSPKWQSQLVALADKACNRTVILGKVVEKQKICRDKQWKVYKPNGHKVCIRDILEKVAFWLSEDYWRLDMLFRSSTCVTTMCRCSVSTHGKSMALS